MESITVDMTDPVVAMVAWALTFGISKIPKLKGNAKLRNCLPLIAFLFAVGGRTLWDQVSGVGFTLDALWHGVIAASLAVMGHSQFSELVKMVGKKDAAKAATTTTTALLLLVFLPPMAGCAHSKVTREAAPYTAEIVASLSRQEAASTHLKAAAEAAKEAGKVELCEDYASPALRIDHRAAGEAKRALWLAGLRYPLADGSIPKVGTEQSDPGDPGPFDSNAATAFCKGE